MTKQTKVLRGIGEVFVGDRLIRHTRGRILVHGELPPPIRSSAR